MDSIVTPPRHTSTPRQSLQTHHRGNSNTPQGEERNSTRETQNPHKGRKSAPRGLFVSSYRLSRSGLPTFWRPLPTFPSPPTGSFGRIIRPPIRPFSEFLAAPPIVPSFAPSAGQSFRLDEAIIVRLQKATWFVALAHKPRFGSSIGSNF